MYPYSMRIHSAWVLISLVSLRTSWALTESIAKTIAKAIAKAMLKAQALTESMAKINAVPKPMAKTNAMAKVMALAIDLQWPRSGPRPRPKERPRPWPRPPRLWPTGSWPKPWLRPGPRPWPMPWGHGRDRCQGNAQPYSNPPIVTKPSKHWGTIHNYRSRPVVKRSGWPKSTGGQKNRFCNPGPPSLNIPQHMLPSVLQNPVFKIFLKIT